MHNSLYLLSGSFLLAASPLSAVLLLINNPDFETGGVADGVYSETPGVVPTGWSNYQDISGNFFGYYNPPSDYYFDASGLPGTTGSMAGPNVFYFGTAEAGEGIEQQLTTTFSAQTTYDLTVALGMRLDFSTANLGMALLAGNTVIASRNIFPLDRFDVNLGTFLDYTLTYTYSDTDAGLIGQPLTIRFTEESGLGPELEIDNVRLEATSPNIPEPAVAPLFGGLAALWLAMRRRKV